MVQLPIFGKLGPESKQLFKTMPAAPGTVKAEIEEDHLDEIYGPIDKRLKMAEPAEQVSRFPLTKFLPILFDSVQDCLFLVHGSRLGI